MLLYVLMNLDAVRRWGVDAAVQTELVRGIFKFWLRPFGRYHLMRILLLSGSGSAPQLLLTFIGLTGLPGCLGTCVTTEFSSATATAVLESDLPTSPSSSLVRASRASLVLYSWARIADTTNTSRF